MKDMYHKLYRVTGFTATGNYTLLVLFDDGTEQEIDFEPVLYGELWGPLRDVALFNRVVIDPIAHTLSWPNGADFDPETLRNWPDYRNELIERAKGWAQIPTS
jgi:hypothetical protein